MPNAAPVRKKLQTTITRYSESVSLVPDMNPKLFFAYEQRYRLNGDTIYANPFAPWTIDDLFPEIEDWDLNLAGYRDLPFCEEIQDWLMSLGGSYWPLWFLVEQSCFDGELLDRDLRETRLAKFPLEAIAACEQAIASVPMDYADELFFMVYWAVRIERARRRGRP